MSEDIEMSERVLKFEFAVDMEKLGVRYDAPDRAEAYAAWLDHRVRTLKLKRQEGYSVFAPREAALLAQIDRLEEENDRLRGQIAKLKEGRP